VASKTVETIFRFTTDQAAVNDVVRDSDRIDRALDDQRRAVERLEDAYTQMEHTAQRVARAEREAAEARIRAARESSEIYGDVASRSTALAGLAGNLSPVLGQRIMLAADLLDATEAAKLMHAELPKLTGQLANAAGGMGTLGVAAGAAALAAIGLYAAINALGNAAEDAREKVLAEIEFEERLAGMDVSGMTTAELDQETSSLREVIDARQEHIDRLQADRDALFDSYNALEQLGEATGVYNQGLDDYDDKLKQLRIEQEADIKVLEGLEDAYKSANVVVNDRLAAEEAYIQSLEDNVAREIALQTKIDTYTMEQVRQETEVLERERTARENQLASLQRAMDEGRIKEELFNRESKRLTGEIDQLNFKIADLNTLVRDAALAREEEADQIDRLKSFLGGIKDAAEEALAAGAEAVRKIQAGALLEAKYEADREAVIKDTGERIAAAEAKHLAQREQAIAEYRSAVNEREAQHTARLDELAAARDERTADLRRQFERDELKRRNDHQRAMARAEEDHNDAVISAAARLDATAVLAEQRRYEKEKSRAEEDFKAEQEQRADQLDERLKQEQDAYDKGVKQAEDAYREQERRQKTQFDKLQAQREQDARNQIAEIRKQGQDRLDALETAHVNAIAQLFGFNSDEYTIRQEHYDRLKAQLAKFRDDTDAVMSGASGGDAGSTSVQETFTYKGTSKGPVRVEAYQQPFTGGMTFDQWLAWKAAGMPAFLKGGYTPYGPIWAHEGEWMATRDTTRLLERGIGGALTQQSVQRFVSSQRTTTTGDMNFYIYESGDVNRTRAVVIEAISELIGA